MLERRARQSGQLVRRRRARARRGRGMSTAAKSAAERLGRRLRRRVVGLVERQRLAEQRGDPVEAALHARLPRPLRVALGVAQRERREATANASSSSTSRLRRRPRSRRGARRRARRASRPPRRIGATSARAKPVVGRVRDGAGDRVVLVRATPARPARARRPASPASGANSKPTSDASRPCTAAQRSTPRSRSSR